MNFSTMSLQAGLGGGSVHEEAEGQEVLVLQLTEASRV